MARPAEVRGGVAQHEDWCSRLDALLSDTSYLFSHVPTQLDKLLVDKVPSAVSQVKDALETWIAHSSENRPERAIGVQLKRKT